MSVKKAMVIGAGQMGGGIAQIMAAAGIETYLNDVNLDIVNSRVEFIGKLLDKDIAKGKIDVSQKDAAMSRLIPSVSLEDAKDCDIVVEAIVENMEIKTSTFRKLDEVCKPGCILASNTSSLPITEIAAVTKRPEKVIGMHFMNPVPVRDLSVELNKTPVEVRDVPGFVSNRVLQMMINEAIYCLYEGVASVEDIDAVMKLGMNHPMGPLQLADFIGLDTVLAIMEVMYEGYADCKYRPCPLLRQYVKAGWLGKKAGRGFYSYE